MTENIAGVDIAGLEFDGLEIDALEFDVARIRNGLQIRRPKLNANLLNESRIKACLSRFDNGSYSRFSSCACCQPRRWSAHRVTTAQNRQ